MEQAVERANKVVEKKTSRVFIPKMKPEEEMEQQLPPGISESGEVVDMAAYEAWQQENHPDIQQQMQRREEVNINVHRERGEDVEPGDDF